MISHLVPVRIGDVEVQIETVREPGTEPTSRLSDAGDRVHAAFGSAHEVIQGMAAKMVSAIDQLATSPAARPANLEIEFGLAFSAKGNIIVASGEANASLKVKLVYDVVPPK
ncbi:hypothetical protein BLA60_27545 [Actinophytocola xinjiangensis]|uniref:Trypsin-co-occurring domain-containing protein n=1 Tax=Actinophytocola xinjiangensis TaxID=485602 RepID=A0A7Z1AVZ1_9PSEU|nr:CU044_2847 family protein [Actinophytocola xinjiangensis]OLF07329.1 hypothetical protein BLA60_27545 [Actinophytocola xinjiangensis]